MTTHFLGHRVQISRTQNFSLSIYHSEFNVGVAVSIPWIVDIHIRLFESQNYAKEMYDHWGFNWVCGKYDGFFEDLHLNWGDKTKIIHLPWSWTWHRHSYLLADESWLHQTAKVRPDLSGWKRMQYFDSFSKWSAQFPYRYTLKNGKIQDRVATVTVEETEWRRKWLKWTPLFARVSRDIHFEFDAEVGERSGSWKGGVIGSSYKLLPGESAEECLQRMEVERKF